MSITNKTNRATLKGYFVKNAIPTEGNFKDLIDACINQADDGIAKVSGEPVSLQPDAGDSGLGKILNFYKDFTDNKPAWTISLNPRSNPADPNTAKPGLSIGDSGGNSKLFIDEATGNIGIGTTATTAARLYAKGPSSGNTYDKWIAGAFANQDGDAVIIGTCPKGATIGAHNNALSAWADLHLNEHVTVTKGGDVGIGTTSPSAKLHVNNGDQSYGAILANATEKEFSLYTKTLTTQGGGSGDSFRLGLKYATDENNGYISFYRGKASDGGYLGFSTSGAERLRINPNGDLTISEDVHANKHVGIGGTLTVSGATTLSTLTVGGDANFGVLKAGAASLSSALVSGKVGIGTTVTATAKLYAKGPSSGNSAVNWIAGAFANQDGDAVVMGTCSKGATIGAHNNALGAWKDLHLNNWATVTEDGRLIRAISFASGRGFDETDHGYVSGRVLTFKKIYVDTWLRITYCDNFRAHVTDNNAAARWEVHIDGKAIPNTPIYLDKHTSNGQNLHDPATIVGYAENIATGTHTIKIHVKSLAGTASNPGTGWQDGRWTIEVEEVRKAS